jgi:hypothetical protein
LLEKLADAPEWDETPTQSEEVMRQRWYFNALRSWKESLLEEVDFYDRIALLAASSLQEHAWNDAHCTMREIALFYLKIVSTRSA